MSTFQIVADGWVVLAWAVTWQLAALALLAWVCEKALRLRQPGVRHALWWFVLVAPLVLAPGRMLLMRHQAVVRLAAPAAVARTFAAVPSVLTRAAPPGNAPRNLRDFAPAPYSTATSRPWWRELRPVDALALAWLLGCSVLGLRLLVGHRRVRRMLAATRRVDEPSAIELLRALCAEAGVRNPVELRSSESVGAPLLYGLWRPVVVVPDDWVSALAPDELRALLAHEVAHIKRPDLLANLALRVIEALLFFHPLAWLASRRIILAREELCDAWALARTSDAAAYARSLTAAAERAYASITAGSVGVAENRFTLLRRVEAIMKTANVRRSGRPMMIGVAVLLAVSAAALATVQVKQEEGRRGPQHASGVALSQVKGPLASDEAQLALQWGGIEMARFSYQVPFEHSLALTMEQYENGKLQKGGGHQVIGKIAPGKYKIVLLAKQTDQLPPKEQVQVVQFSTVHAPADGDRRSPVSMTTMMLALGGYTRQVRRAIAPGRLVVGEKTPMWWLVADVARAKQWTEPRLADGLEKVVSTHDLVVVASLQLERYPAVRGAANDPENVDLSALFGLAEQGLRKHFAGWRVIPRSDFDAAVTRFVLARCRSGEGPERCAGDFDGNGLMDVAFVVHKGDYVRYVALNQTKRGEWDPHVLSGTAYRGGFQGGYKGFTVFLMRHGPGNVRFLSEGGGTINLEHPGVEVCFWEKAAVLYYWAGANYVSRITGD